VATSALAVTGGEALGRLVPAIWIRRAAGVVFIGMGLLYLLQRSD
jgi:putative Ca2+/H+ antiporter (TMEM165/GDT1 family)